MKSLFALFVLFFVSATNLYGAEEVTVTTTPTVTIPPPKITFARRVFLSHPTIHQTFPAIDINGRNLFVTNSDGTKTLPTIKLGETTLTITSSTAIANTTLQQIVVIFPYYTKNGTRELSLTTAQGTYKMEFAIEEGDNDRTDGVNILSVDWTDGTFTLPRFHHFGPMIKIVGDNLYIDVNRGGHTIKMGDVTLGMITTNYRNTHAKGLRPSFQEIAMNLPQGLTAGNYKVTVTNELGNSSFDFYYPGPSGPPPRMMKGTKIYECPTACTPRPFMLGHLMPARKHLSRNATCQLETNSTALACIWIGHMVHPRAFP